MIKLDTKEKRIIYTILLFAFGIISGIIYYEIQCGVMQSHEETQAIILNYYDMKGENTLISWYRFFLKLAILWKGVCYDAQRVAWAMYWSCITILCADISLRDNRKNVRIEAIPCVFLLMVCIHLSGEYISTYWGDGSFGDKIFTTYPFSIHITAHLAFLWVLWWNYRLLGRNLKRYIKIIIEIAVLVSGYFIAGIQESALVTCIIFLPLLFWGIRDFLYTKKNGYYVFWMLFGMILICGLAIVGFHDYLPATFTSLYRNAGLKEFHTLWNQVLYYVSCILCIFNADYHIPDLSLFKWSGYIIRIGMVLLLYGFVINRLFCLLRKENDFKEKDEDYLQNNISLAILFVLFAFIFTSLGMWDRTRYLAFVLSGGTILICHNWDRIKKLFHAKSGVLIGLCCWAIITSYDPNWNVHVTDEAMEEVVAAIEDMGLHEGLGNMNCSAKITPFSHGEHWCDMVTYDGEKIYFALNINRESYFYDYFVFKNGEAYGSNEITTQVLLDLYGKPDEIKAVAGYTIVVYRKGIDLSGETDFSADGDTMAVLNPVYYYPMDLEFSETAVVSETSAVLPKGAEQYGPYITFVPGKFWVLVEAENLNPEDVKMVVNYEGRNELGWQLIEETENSLLFEFEIPQFLENIEFIIENTSDKDVILYDYRVTDAPDWEE